MLPPTSLQPPAHPILRNSAPVRLMTLIGLIPLTLTVFASLAAWVSGATLDELQLPLITMGAMSLLISLLFGAFAALLTLGEWLQIRAIYRQPLAQWPQYSTDRQWEKQAEDAWEKAQKASRIEWVGLIVVTVIFVGISIWVLVQFGEPYVLIAIGGMYLIILSIMVGGKIVNRIRGQMALQRGRSMERPSLIVGRRGLYHEGEGFTSLAGLQTVEWIPPDQVGERLKELNRDYLETGTVGRAFDRQLAESGWGLLAFTTRRWTRYGIFTQTALARVPPDAAEQALSVAAQFDR